LSRERINGDHTPQVDPALFDSIVVDDDVDFTDPYDLERVVLEKPWRDNA